MNSTLIKKDQQTRAKAMSLCPFPKKIIHYFETNANKLNEISNDLKHVDLIPLKYGHNMSQMTCVYQRPKIDKQRVD